MIHHIEKACWTGLALCAVLVTTSLTVTASQAAENVGIEMPVWPDGAKTANGLTGPETQGGCVGNISNATMTVYLPEKSQATGAAVVVIPGGGYQVVCTKTEGEAIADLLLPRGIAAIVVKYRLPNRHHTIPADDVRRAIRSVRFRAADWNLDPDRVGVWGFSAGGHLASTVSTVFDDGRRGDADPIERLGSRPDFSILFYPVITMDPQVTHGGSRNNLLGPDASAELLERYSSERRVTPQTPPTFMLQCADDPAVPAENTLRYYRQLLENEVAVELLLYERGGHGPNAFNQNPSWLGAFDAWLTRRNLNEFAER